MLLCARRQTLTYFTGSFKNPSKYCTLVQRQALRGFQIYPFENRKISIFKLFIKGTQA
jgi:hypothetical protein